MKRIIALLVTAGAAWASQRGFNVEDDVLAFPQVGDPYLQVQFESTPTNFLSIILSFRIL